MSSKKRGLKKNIQLLNHIDNVTSFPYTVLFCLRKDITVAEVILSIKDNTLYTQ